MFRILSLFLIGALINQCKTKDNEKTDDTTSENTQSQEISIEGLSLNKPYWHLFKNTEQDDDDICYFVPRPDNVEASSSACSAEHELNSIFAQYDLCKEVVDPDVINNIPCSTAKQISIELHSHLVFNEEGPWIDAEDAALACEKSYCSSNTAVSDYCQYYTRLYERIQAGEPIEAIARQDTDEEKQNIAVCVNEVYGIEDQ